LKHAGQSPGEQGEGRGRRGTGEVGSRGKKAGAMEVLTEVCANWKRW
jgi:hypothetical protein